MSKDKSKSKRVMSKSGGSVGGAFFMGWVGALFYFEGIAYGFWPSVLAFLKACVWPAYIVHAVLGLLNIR